MQPKRQLLVEITFARLKAKGCQAHPASSKQITSNTLAAAANWDNDATDDGKRRGGKKYQAQKLRRSQSVQNRLDMSSEHPNRPSPVTNTKRFRTKDDTPPEVMRRNKKAKNSTQISASTPQSSSTSMADAMKDANLLVAVIDLPVPNHHAISKENYRKIYEAMTTFGMADIENSKPLPVFDENSYVQHQVQKLDSVAPCSIFLNYGITCHSLHTKKC